MARPKKIVRFRLQTFQNRSKKGSVSWRITGTKIDGSRVRINFSDKTEAVQALADLEAEAEGHREIPRVQRTRLSAAELADAEAALLAAPARPIAPLVAHYVALEARAKAKGLSLDAAVSFVESHFREEIREISVLNAYSEFLGTRSGVSPATVAYYGATLRSLLRPDPNKLLHTFTVADLDSRLSRISNRNSKRTYRGAYKTFFNWAVRHHHCLEDPCKRLDKLPKDLSQVAILSLDEVKRLLSAAARYQEGAAAASIAIELFAGLRPSELADLSPGDIRSERIRVTGGKLRRKLKRTVPIPPVLAAWLERFPFKGLPDGWLYKLKKLKEATKAAQWVQDIRRHTSISFQTERDKNEALTAYNCGTSIKMMDLHYRNSIDEPKVVEEFWSLTPDRILSADARLELPTRNRVEWPDKGRLKKLVWEKPLSHAAKQLGVSDVALKKRCLREGVECPPMGHWPRNKSQLG